MTNPTEKRFPRTLAEAFPDPRQWLDGPYPSPIPWWERLADWALAILIGLAFFAAFGGFSC